MLVTDLATLEMTKVLASSGLLAGLPKWAADGKTLAGSGPSHRLPISPMDHQA